MSDNLSTKKKKSKKNKEDMDEDKNTEKKVFRQVGVQATVPVAERGEETNYTYKPDENVVRREVQELKTQIHYYTQEEKEIKNNLERLTTQIEIQTQAIGENKKATQNELKDLKGTITIQTQTIDENKQASQQALTDLKASITTSRRSEPLPPINTTPVTVTNRNRDEEKETLIDVLKRQHFYVLIIWKILIMLAAAVLIASIYNISEVKPCQLQAALDDIQLKYSPHPCRHNAIKNTSENLYICGGLSLFINILQCIFILLFRHCKCSDGCFKVFTIVSLIINLILILALFILYHVFVIDKKDEQNYVDYVHLQSSMLSWLEATFKSDNVSSGDDVSRHWNTFFIKYDCCGVREVTGTTNDFDNTPWCTTSGSCQSTSSQIPKTCCKDVTLSNYQSAPSACHASVNPGTFKSSCISHMKEMSNVNIEAYDVVLFSFLPLVIGVLQVIDFFLLTLPIVRFFRDDIHCNKGICCQKIGSGS